LKRKRRIIIGIFSVAVIIAVAIFVIYQNAVNDYQKMIADTTYQNMDASLVPDGEYIGEYDTEFVYAKVCVTVKSGTIAAIDLLEHRNGRGTPAERIIDDILAQQKIDVDAVSGATNSSIVIKKAVDNALSNALSE